MTPRITQCALPAGWDVRAGCAHSAHLRAELPALEMACATLARTFPSDRRWRERGAARNLDARPARREQRVGIMPVADSYSRIAAPP